MTLAWHHLVELGAIALALGFTLWVLVVQPLALVRTMPRPRFLGFQMRAVRAWVRALVPLTATVLAMVVVRVGLGASALPAAAACGAAALAAWWAVPRALRAGGEAARDDAGALSEAGFLSEGGGAQTRVWHRVVLACVAVVLVGLTLDGRDALAHRAPPPCHGCDPHARPHADEGPPVQAPRVLADAATARAIADFEREVAVLLASGGGGDTAALRAAWGRIFSSCTMQGEAHERLHEFLMPLMEAMAQVDATAGAGRLPVLRAMLRRLGTFDERFTVGS